MSAESKSTKPEWVDPDDAPELTGEEPDRPDAKWFGGDREVPPEEGQAAFRKILAKRQVNMWLDVAVIEYFKAKAGGRGYQTLINETLKKAIEGETLESIVRRVLREEIQRGCRSR